MEKTDLMPKQRIKKYMEVIEMLREKLPEALDDERKEQIVFYANEMLYRRYILGTFVYDRKTEEVYLMHNGNRLAKYVFSGETHG